MAERVTTIEERMTAPEQPPTSPPTRRRRLPWILSVLAVAALAIIAIVMTGDGSGGADPGTTVAPTVADVVRTDLEEVSTYEGTLGSIEGDPVQSQLTGTITAAAEAGQTVSPGQVLYEVDGEPVALLAGAIPAYRTMTAIGETSAVAAATTGTITWLPDDGTVVEQGDVLFEVDGAPVVLLYGDVPFYRTLFDASTNLVGDDVAQLERALTDLGLNDGVATVDDEFTAATENLVEDFEEAYGLNENGRIDPGEIVFLPGPVEVVSVDAAVGDAVAAGRPVLTVADVTAGGTEGPDVLQLEESLAALGHDADGTMVVDGLFTVETRSAVRSFQRTIGADDDGVVDLGEVVFRSEAVFVSDRLLDVGSPVNRGSAVLAVASADKFVTLDLPAADQENLTVGQTVVVELPNRSRIEASVESIATVATRGPDGATFEVVIILGDSSAAAGLDEAPVDVDVVTDSVRQVMAVPVTALLALREGGYAVELLQGDGTIRRVGVEPGFYADGMVEIESNDVAPGDQVIVP